MQHHKKNPIRYKERTKPTFHTSINSSLCPNPNEPPIKPDKIYTPPIKI